MCMRKKVLGLICAVGIILFAGCGGDDPEPGSREENLGTFAGSIQVSDDPFTGLGYIYNAKVSVASKGTDVTIKVTGDPGFDREFTGKTDWYNGDMYSISIDHQKKPADKISGDALTISGNKLTIRIDIAGENVLVRKNTGTTETMEISGKITMIGTNLLLEE